MSVITLHNITQHMSVITYMSVNITTYMSVITLHNIYECHNVTQAYECHNVTQHI